MCHRQTGKHSGSGTTRWCYCTSAMVANWWPRTEKWCW